MPTLGNMKSELARQLRRSGLDNDISAEISRAIRFYRQEKFWFNTQTTVEFTTVADQWKYTASDDSDLGKIYKIDFVTLNDGSEEYTVEKGYGESLSQENLLSGSASGRPTDYGRIGQEFILHPKPDAAYTVKIACHYQADEPADDTVTDNVWTNEAYDLIFYRAKALIYSDTLRNDAEAAKAVMREREYYNALIDETDKRTATGNILPTEF